MHDINPQIKFFLNLGKAQAALSQRFDRGLGGLGFSEFLILISLDQAEDGKMRRVDLAKKIGLTASGVTRLLLPMEKVGLVKSGPVEDDARVRFVVLAPGGKRKLDEAMERLEILAAELIPSSRNRELSALSELLMEIGGKALML